MAEGAFELSYGGRIRLTKVENDIPSKSRDCERSHSGGNHKTGVRIGAVILCYWRGDFLLWVEGAVRR